MSKNLFSPPEFSLLDAETKDWIEARSSFVLHQFGAQRVRTCPVVLPTTDFFPRRFSKTEDEARAVLDRLCRFLDVDPRTVTLDLFDAGQPADGGPTPLGVYQSQDDRFHIGIDASQLHEPLDLAATMAHELCHVLLLGHGRVTEQEDDHEPLTDLTTVLLGLGVVTANAALRDVSWRGDGMEGWQISARGYFTMQMYGYALALFSRLRDEDGPAWAKHLRPDVRHAFRKSLRYFSQYGLPELRSLRTTAARPSTIREESPAEDSERGGFSDIDGEIAVCSFCAQELVGDELSAGICAECHESIEENREQIECERQAVAAAHRRSWKIIRFGFFLLVVLTLVAILLSHIGGFD